KRFVDFFKQQPETGMGYWVVTAVLKDGRRYDQVVVNSGFVTRVKGHRTFRSRNAKLTILVTHEKWDFGGKSSESKLA
ncbi:MAG TPA: hypothetical protein VF957_10920, partial [Bradyrhizobium sp.]